MARTLRPLAAGGAAFLSYGPQVGEMAAPQRQQLLLEHYSFTCSCPACASAEAAAAEASLVGLRCTAGAGCEGAVVPPGPLPAGVVSQHALGRGDGACSRCGAMLALEEWQGRMLPQLEQAAASHEAALQALQRLGPEASSQGILPVVRVLREVLRQRQQLLHPRNQLLGATHDALACAWNAAGTPEPAAQHLRHSLAALQRAYPHNSTAVAFQQCKLAALLRAVAAGGGEAAEAEADRLLEAASQTLQLHFGPQAASKLLAQA